MLPGGHACIDPDSFTVMYIMIQSNAGQCLPSSSFVLYLPKKPTWGVGHPQERFPVSGNRFFVF